MTPILVGADQLTQPNRSSPIPRQSRCRTLHFFCVTDGASFANETMPLLDSRTLILQRRIFDACARGVSADVKLTHSADFDCLTIDVSITIVRIGSPSVQMGQ